MLKASPFEICNFIFSQLLAKSWTTGQNRVSVLGQVEVLGLGPESVQAVGPELAMHHGVEGTVDLVPHVAVHQLGNLCGAVPFESLGQLLLARHRLQGLGVGAEHLLGV